MAHNFFSAGIQAVYVPVMARTCPTSAVVKLKPPRFLGLTAHNEKIWRNRTIIKLCPHTNLYGNNQIWWAGYHVKTEAWQLSSNWQSL